MGTVKTHVIRCLDCYESMSRQIELLRTELMDIPQIKSDEMLEILAFSKGECGAVTQGYVSNKTASVAMKYQDETMKVNSEVKNAIINQLTSLVSKKERLDRCIALLSLISNKVIIGLFVQQRTIKDLALEMHVSERTVQRYRDNAIDELVSMYELLEEVGIVF